MRGADIHTVALLLGHKDLRMAARYQHLSPEYLQVAVKRLDDVFAAQDLSPATVTKKAIASRSSGLSDARALQSAAS